jgi:hypothetical protein
MTHLPSSKSETELKKEDNKLPFVSCCFWGLSASSPT